MTWNLGRITVWGFVISCFKYYSLPLSKKHTVLFITSFSRMVSELHVPPPGWCELFKLVETFQPFFGLKFCCFLSWKNDPTKLRGSLQHLMPAINQDLEVWVRQNCYWAAWKHFKGNVLNWKSLDLNLNDILWGQWWESCQLQCSHVWVLASVILSLLWICCPENSLLLG